MRIEQHGPDYDKQVRLDVTSEVDEKRQAAAARAKREVKDEASFSEQARLLSQAHATYASQPDVREARVADLQKQIEAGTYEVPVAALTRHLIDKLG
jgi:flagellar biosynthesis anti-sigma factor FlgM